MLVYQRVIIWYTSLCFCLITDLIRQMCVFHWASFSSPTFSVSVWLNGIFVSPFGWLEDNIQISSNLQICTCGIQKFEKEFPSKQKRSDTQATPANHRVNEFSSNYNVNTGVSWKYLGTKLTQKTLAKGSTKRRSQTDLSSQNLMVKFLVGIYSSLFGKEIKRPSLPLYSLTVFQQYVRLTGNQSISVSPFQAGSSIFSKPTFHHLQHVLVGLIKGNQWLIVP